MRVITAVPGDIVYETDGPPRLIVANVEGDTVTLVVHDHPEDDETEMRMLARRLGPIESP